MTKKQIICALLVVCSLMLITCKKYPEGGYQKDGHKNLINKWKLTLYEVDGIDSTNLINYNGDENYKQITFTPSQSASNTTYGVILGANNGFEFVFSSNKEALTITARTYYGARDCHDNLCFKEIFTPESNYISWKILKLDSKELHLQSQQIHSYNLKLIKTTS